MTDRRAKGTPEGTIRNFWWALDETRGKTSARTRHEQCLAGKRFLLAEDNEDILMASAALLKRHGARVDTCTNGDDALQAARQGGYDCILLDYQMPGKDGMEVARILVHEGVKADVLVFSASYSEHEVYESGGVRMLPKPLSLEALLRASDSLS